MDYEKGQQFKLRTHVGAFEEHGGVHTLTKHENEEFEAFLDRHHPLWEGQVGTVEAVTEMQGIEHVILTFEYHDPNTREVVPGREASRNVSFTQQQMDEWFEEVKA